METIGFLTPFVLLGIAVLFVAFSGGPARARQAYLTRGNRGFRVAVPMIYVALGLVVPTIIILNREEAIGGTAATANLKDESLQRGKGLFRQSCASCHTLQAANARGVTGPSLDELGVLDEKRIVNAIRIGGTGEDRMPAGLLEGDEAREVGRYISRVAGR